MSNGYLIASAPDLDATREIAEGFGLDVIDAASVEDHAEAASALAVAANVGFVISSASNHDNAFVALLRSLSLRLQTAQLIFVDASARAELAFLPNKWPSMTLEEAKRRIARRREASAVPSADAPRAAPMPAASEQTPVPEPNLPQAQPAQVENPKVIETEAETPVDPEIEPPPYDDETSDAEINAAGEPQTQDEPRLVSVQPTPDAASDIQRAWDAIRFGENQIQPEAARGHFNEALAAANSAIASAPDNGEAQQLLAVSHVKLGDLDAKHDAPENARAHYAEALRIAEAMAAADPSDADAALATVSARVRLADLAQETGDHDEAEAQYEHALRIAEPLASEDPDDEDTRALANSIVEKRAANQTKIGATETPPPITAIPEQQLEQEPEPDASFGEAAIEQETRSEPESGLDALDDDCEVEEEPAEGAPEAQPPAAAAPAPQTVDPAPPAAAGAKRSEAPPHTPAAAPSSAPADATAFAPKKLRRGTPELVRVVVHQPSQLKDVIKTARQIDPRTTPAPQGMSIGEVALGAEIGVTLDVRGAACDGEIQRRIWNGEPLDFNFSAEAEDDVKQAVFLARVFIGDAQIGVIAFTRGVTGSQKAAAPGKARLNRHKRVFLSYSSTDRETVSVIATAYEMAGVQHFWDRTSLKSGEEWSPRLRREIDRADLFHLCWSKAASASEWVEKETEHALTRHKKTRGKRPEITVQMLDGPPWAPHPPHLDAINFDDFVRAAIVGYARGDGED